MTVTVIVPVRDGASLIGQTVATLSAEVAGLGGEVLVIDDASRDATGAIAERAGARVIRRSTPGGPYAARNVGWRSAEHDLVAFVDVRCRPRAGWARALLAPFEERDVALVGGDVFVVEGDRVAERAAGRLEPLRLPAPSEVSFLAFAPTCNLAARRDIVERVGGFAEVRGGADVDLCWRVQHGGYGRFAAAPDAVLDWVPRTSVRGLLRQYHRYGFNHGRLAVEWRAAGCPAPQVHAPARVLVHELRAQLRAEDRDVAAAVAGAIARARYAAGLRHGVSAGDDALGPGPVRTPQ